MPIGQLEHVYLITSHPLRVENKDHIHFDGSNQGMVLGYVHAPKWSDSKSNLRVDAKTIKTIFGKTGVSAVGGSVEGGEDADPPEKQADNQEPAFPHAEPYELDAELAHSYACVAHIDLTVGHGHRALYSCIKKNPYLGFCITESHKPEVQKWLESRVFDAMQEEGHTRYQPALAELISVAQEEDEDGDEGDNGGEEEEEDEDGGGDGEVDDEDDDGEDDEDADPEDDDEEQEEDKKGKPKPKPKPKAKAATKGKPKTKAKAANQGKKELLAKLAVLQAGAKKKGGSATKSKAGDGSEADSID